MSGLIDGARYSPDNELAFPHSYSPLPIGEGEEASWCISRRSLTVPCAVFSTFCLFFFMAALLHGHDRPVQPLVPQGYDDKSPLWPRGVSEGVSSKSTILRSEMSYDWTNAMLSWQRTAFHFQPEKNWMNDPNGPLFYKGWYHLFYQYNPDSSIWGNITWGHAISRDLVHWLYLPLAMVPDRWYDANGVWTGSATLLPSGELIMLYTGSTNESIQVQNLAHPANPDDPLLLNWIKDDDNPVLFPPSGIATKDFRDPTTGWLVSDGTWRVAIGSKANTTGIMLVYKTRDFRSYELLDGILHAVPGTGMWECADFYPVSTVGDMGLDTSANGPSIKHVLKVSLDEDRHDYYAIGNYDAEHNTWSPDNPELDVGIAKRYDYGKFYASKTFYDQRKERRILWGWIGETDSELTDLQKGWASLQAIPRVVTFDRKTGNNLLQWPVDEIESLRVAGNGFTGVVMPPGSLIPLSVGNSTQLDILAEFEIPRETAETVVEAEVAYNCSTSAGAAERSKLGPFGLLVLADRTRSEQTAVYFHVSRNSDGDLNVSVCQDESRSSMADDIIKRVYGSSIQLLQEENFRLRILVDHSIVETFAQGGRACITSRVYPTRAIYGGAQVFLFNNATESHVIAKSIKIWHMSSALNHPYFE